jgi:hypothetical protein
LISIKKRTNFPSNSFPTISIISKLGGFSDNDKLKLYLNKYYLTINWLKDIIACGTQIKIVVNWKKFIYKHNCTSNNEMLDKILNWSSTSYRIMIFTIKMVVCFYVGLMTKIENFWKTTILPLVSSIF